MRDLTLEILTPSGPVAERRVRSLRAADTTGSLGILPGHEPFLGVLVAGLLSFEGSDGQAGFVAIDGGILLLSGDRAIVATRDAVPAATLEEVVSAVERMVERRRAAERKARSEFAELEALLRRALAGPGPQR